MVNQSYDEALDSWCNVRRCPVQCISMVQMDAEFRYVALRKALWTLRWLDKLGSVVPHVHNLDPILATKMNNEDGVSF